jgi:hypothetical protein
MLNYKSTHIWGFDNEIFKNIKSNSINNYYLYIWDYCHMKIDINDSFYEKECNENNTWNINLKYKDTCKDEVVLKSKKHGFADLSYNNEDCRIITKPLGHKNSTREKQCKEIKKDEIIKYNKNEYIIQKLIKNKDNRELNVYIFRNLNTKELYMVTMYIYTTKMKTINRKDSFENSYALYINDIKNELKDKYQNFINYINDINFDYGRIELIEDDIIGWSIIDVNNSPGSNRYNNKTYDIQGNKININNILFNEFKKTLE